MNDNAATRPLKVLCWNVLLTNRDLDGIGGFLRAESPDICLFQELSEEHVAFLRKMPDRHISIAEDCIEGKAVSYLAIVTRTPVLHSRVIDHNPGRNLSPSVVGRRFGWVENLQSQSVDIAVGETVIRIVNAHLPVAVGPSARVGALDELHPHFEGDVPAIFGGDMNSWSRPILNLAFGCLFGFAAGDRFQHDRRNLAQFAKQNGFAPVFENVITYPRLRLQLDHVFLRRLEGRSARIEKSCFGSDHRPLVVEIGVPVAHIPSRDIRGGPQQHQ